MKIAFATLGCKVNQYETENLIELFLSDQFDVVDADEEADVYVINSCTVTSTGDKKTLKIIRKLKKQNPNAKIALTGCLPQAFPDEAKLIKEADIIMGNSNRKKLLDAVKEVLVTNERIVDITPHKRKEAFEKMSVMALRGRTRAFVKIEDGCERYCSYCIIPKARGFVRSKTLEDIKTELEALAENGYKEVVLVGINLSSYGKDLGLRLIDAVKKACEVEKIERIRLGSLEPELLSDDDLKEMSNLSKFCPQFHLALQSGCDKTLKAMNRHYDCEEFLRIVNKIRDVFENPSITTDIMVGFPGETEEDFNESLRFAEKIKFAKAHIFAYSPREGTIAAKKVQIPESEKEKRSRKMIETVQNIRLEFLKTQVGKIQKVLLETTKDNFGYEGFTENYTPVSVDCSDEYCGQIINVKIIGIEGDRCIGEITEV